MLYNLAIVFLAQTVHFLGGWLRQCLELPGLAIRRRILARVQFGAHYGMKVFFSRALFRRGVLELEQIPTNVHILHGYLARFKATSLHFVSLEADIVRVV